MCANIHLANLFSPNFDAFIIASFLRDEDRRGIKLFSYSCYVFYLLSYLYLYFYFILFYFSFFFLCDNH
jgi:hypothetical protein